MSEITGILFISEDQRGGQLINRELRLSDSTRLYLFAAVRPQLPETPCFPRR